MNIGTMLKALEEIQGKMAVEYEILTVAVNRLEKLNFNSNIESECVNGAVIIELINTMVRTRAKLDKEILKLTDNMLR